MRWNLACEPPATTSTARCRRERIPTSITPTSRPSTFAPSARNRITVARGRYIQLVQDYNTYIRQFPVNLTAMVFGHKTKPNFTVENEAQIQQAPNVDFAAPPMLVSDGKRDILVAGQKNGAAYGIDPDTGKLVWKNQVGRGGNQGGTHFGLAADGATVFVPQVAGADGLQRRGRDAQGLGMGLLLRGDRPPGRTRLQVDSLETILAETYGIFVYQEQVMQTAQILGGYSLGGADLLRRAMGKKKAEEMAEHREKFRAGALATHNIPQDKADEVFDLMEKFAGYGFNKSHAAAYSLLAYHTGWLKVHYTAEFFCANMTVEMDDTDKLKVLYEDAVKFGITFDPPDVNRGTHRFEPVTDKVIRYGLGAIKGTGQQAIDAIVAARNQGGPFTSLFDFAVRVDRSRINKRTVDALIKAGAFDSLHMNRAALSASIDRAFEFSSATTANANQGGLFDMLGDDSHGSSTQEPDLVEVMPWGIKERLLLEKTAVGFFLSGHLFDAVEREVRQFARRKIDDLIDSREPQLMAGIVSDLRIINGQRGKVAIFKLDDKSGVMEATADEALINSAKHLLKDDELIIVTAKMQADRFSGGFRLKIEQVMDLGAARCRYGKYLRVAVNGRAPDIARLVKEFPAQREQTDQGDLVRGLPVRLVLERRNDELAARAELALGEAAKFFPTDAALASWMAQADQGQARIVYD